MDVIIETQKDGFYEVDLGVCDETHRTTGGTKAGTEERAFGKGHGSYTKLRMTTTPNG
ncbi:hypothetical protein ACEF17_12595 [Streptococcus hyovaginalis]